MNTSSSSEAQPELKRAPTSKKGKAKGHKERKQGSKQPAFTLADFLHKPFQYAPEYPKEDLWTTILEGMKPLMDKDKAQCENWKDEVANLLIFAGLFSAVVTAFVIESYKTAQQDANVVLIGLLHHIANRLDGPLNNNGTFPPPLSPNPDSIVSSFTQTSSSCHINVFWFLSLILSLATVLIGTISLQWLRQHLSYTDLTSKEIVAVFRMRSKALEGWYVPQIFAALPLLLQGSLVLFLAGMVDFVLLLGNSIAIPVCVFISITLLFLLATTVLPTLQGFAMYFPLLYPQKTVPAPCPYKSPQSHVFHRLSAIIIFPLLHVFVPILSHPYKAIWSFRSKRRDWIAGYGIDITTSWIYPQGQHWTQPSNSTLSFLRHLDWSELVEKHHVITYISDIWRQPKQAKFELGWLFIRDAYQHGIEDTPVDLYDEREDLWQYWYADDSSAALPWYDMIQSIQEVVVGIPGSKHTDSFFSAVYYSFISISCSNDWYLYRYRRTPYFYSLLKSTPNLLPILVKSSNWPHSTPLWDHLFHHDYLYLFLGNILEAHAVPALNKLQQEVKMRFMWGLFYVNHKAVLNTTLTLPSVCSVNSYADLRYAEGENNAVTIIDVLTVLFTHIASHSTDEEHLMQSLHTNPGIPGMLSGIAHCFVFYLHDSWRGLDRNLQYSSQCNSLFELIAEHLNAELKDRQPESSPDGPSVLFYLASFFGRPFVVSSTSCNYQNLSQHLNINTLLDVMQKYKEMTPGKNHRVEERFLGATGYFNYSEFSDEWWAEFLDPCVSPPMASQSSAQDLDSIDEANIDATPLSQPKSFPYPDNDNQDSKVPESLSPIHPDSIHSPLPISFESPQDSVIDMPISPSLSSQEDETCKGSPKPDNDTSANPDFAM